MHLEASAVGFQGWENKIVRIIDPEIREDILCSLLVSFNPYKAYTHPRKYRTLWNLIRDDIDFGTNKLSNKPTTEMEPTTKNQRKSKLTYHTKN